MLRLHVLLVMIMNVRLLGTSFLETLSPSCLNVCFPVTTLLLRRAQGLLLRLAIPTTLPRVPGASKPHAIGKVHAPNCILAATHRLTSRRRRSQSPPARSTSGAPYESAGYGTSTGGATYNGSSGGYVTNGYSNGAPARSSGSNRDYAPPRSREVEPASSYRRS